MSRGRVTVVAGPPCAGKNTYIEANAQPGDVIVDFDAIMQGLTGGESHSHDPALRKRAHAIRDKQIADLLASGERGWIISSGARSDARHRYGLPVVVLAPPIDVPLRRALTERPEEWIGYVHDWYQRFEPDSRDVVINGSAVSRQLTAAEVERMAAEGRHEEIVAAQRNGQLAELLGGG